MIIDHDYYVFLASQNLPNKKNFSILGPLLLRPLFTEISVGSTPIIRSLISLNFWHRTNIKPHTWSYDFAKTLGFGKQSSGPDH
ncbi:hypothetical protein GQ457_14G021060 [Hibiscus cannabinus]